MKLSEIKSNPNNPRVIKDHKFEKLKKSISEFPKMMELRPMVINEDNIVLGGNMRLKALKDLGYKEVPEEWVKRASDLTEEETRRFIIADNVGFGEHDWEMLANEWDSLELEEWGFDLPKWSEGLDVNNMQVHDEDLEEDFNPIGKMDGKQRVVFLFDGPEEAESYLNNLKVDFKKMNMAWQVNFTTDIE
jgi:hypothetical protein